MIRRKLNVITIIFQGSNRDASDSRSNMSVATSATQMTLPSRIASPSANKRGQLGSANLKYGFEKQKRYVVLPEVLCLQGQVF